MSDDKALADWLLEQIAEDKRDADTEDRDFARTSLLPTYDSGHQERWSTDRVRAECDAKRQIIDICALAVRSDGERATAQTVLAEETLRRLALPYSDRPGYREEWRP